MADIDMSSGPQGANAVVGGEDSWLTSIDQVLAEGADLLAHISPDVRAMVVGDVATVGAMAAVDAETQAEGEDLPAEKSFEEQLDEMLAESTRVHDLSVVALDNEVVVEGYSGDDTPLKERLEVLGAPDEDSEGTQEVVKVTETRDEKRLRVLTERDEEKLEKGIKEVVKYGAPIARLATFVPDHFLKDRLAITTGRVQAIEALLAGYDMWQPSRMHMKKGGPLHDITTYWQADGWGMIDGQKVLVIHKRRESIAVNEMINDPVLHKKVPATFLEYFIVNATTTAEEILEASPGMVNEYTAERIQQYLEAGHANGYYDDTEKVVDNLFQYVVEANIAASVKLLEFKPEQAKSKKSKKAKKDK